MAMSVSGGRRTKRGGRGARAPMSEINVTPFVDVMLVLLIIFMITAPLLKAGVPIELPDSRAKALSEEQKQVTLSLDGAGALFIDDQAVAMRDLPRALAALPRDAQGRAPLVTLRADKALDYGTVMGVMGELNRAGLTSISLVTRASSTVPGVEEPSEDSLSDGSGEEE